MTSKALARRRAALLPSVPLAMRALDRLEAEIPNVVSFEEVQAYADTAAGLQRKYRPVREVANRAGLVWVVAVRKIGAELKRVPRAKGGEHGGKRRLDGTRSEPSKKLPTLHELGIGKKLAVQARKIDELSSTAENKLVKSIVDAGKLVTPTAILSASRQKAKVEKKHQLAAAAFNADGLFGTAVIDWAWPVQKIDRDDYPNQDAFDYPVMAVEDMPAFWKKHIEPRLEDDCHVFFWTTEKFLPAALKLAEQCDLRYVLLMVWHKPGGFQPVELPQYNAEFIVYARRGSPIFIDTKDFDVCFEAPRREHSRKPAKFYQTIARVTGGSRLDVFAREQHPGFAQYGNEVDKFKQAAE
jgi:N6-adenosine-specific RNA methylase IME4